MSTRQRRLSTLPDATRRTGTYRVEEGVVVQLMVLGDHLLSLYSNGGLRVWKVGSYDEPEVSRI